MGYGTEIDGCGRFMKYSLFFTNFIIFIGGVAIAGLSIWSLVDNVTAISELIGTNLLTGAVYVLLVGGIVIAFISFLGCVGASREIKCMLLSYFIVVLLLFVTVLIGGVLGYVFREKVKSNVQQDLKNSMSQYDKHSRVRDAWDITQSTLHCCGVKSWDDWRQYELQVPKSCCKEISPGRYFDCSGGSDKSNPSNTYQVGCLNSTQLYVQKHAAIIGGAGIAVACLMFFGMVFSCALFKMIE
ncbi:CD151 antigen [Diprion similis]|uniref:CD151 antigen n=1 Tax=Diprion similis TaxID=362088 RepID=UPI001EF90D7B|nr:CD151 antigen [Diprion similis]